MPGRKAPGPPKKRKYAPLTREQQQKAKLYRKAHKKPYVPKVPTVHDLLRQVYKEAGASTVFRYKRVHANDLQRLLSSQGITGVDANFLTDKESLELKASLTGLKPGRIALTLPERLVIQWLEYNNYSFGGVFPNITNSRADFFSQYPLGGGRNSYGGGAVADIFLSAGASRTDKGLALAVDGAYFHSQQSISGRDDAQNKMLEALGFGVARVRDTVVYHAGQLEGFMRSLLGNR